ncbi:xyloglucan O-acetyltransferase 3-like [Mercurialis annua]|uniref:xyloglucan O-acetyltransferase 3-like n=1 Tax=Mercurialis annua TaxID=3986 RepID=UPI002160D845|nr:xyloglucan O-acetyltransferase 3-like [Mercurialis annua]
MNSIYYIVGLTFLFTFFIIFSPDTCKLSNNLGLHQWFPLQNDKRCDLFSGHWVPDLRGSQYTNVSCKSIPDSKNCFKHGRNDTNFLNWRWKPDGCELPRFDPRIFFAVVRGKTMAFIGDSVARNHVESLLCLLSLEEIPLNTFRDADNRSLTWHFPNNNFTLMVLWTKFLVKAEERVVNGTNSGSFDLHVDKIERNWTSKLPEMDYAIISGVHWLFRKNYLYENGNLIGCIYCNEPDTKSYNLEYGIERITRLVLKYINNCKQCKSGLVTLLRTYSPAHFENGSWNTGGNCNRTKPFREGEINLESSELKLRSIQAEELQKARKVGKRGNYFEILDVTKAMLMRPDGHPDGYWGNKWMQGYNDCVHWCMPGPIDVWNDLLMALLKRFTDFSILKEINQ